MTNHLVSRFRVKKLSPKQRLPVLKASQLPDFEEAVKLSRAIPLIESGVEKEEEEEHDLQAAITAARQATTAGDKISCRYIPTPDASQTIDMAAYYRVYKPLQRLDPPPRLIRFTLTDNELFSQHPYALDEHDVAFLAKCNSRHPPQPHVSEDELEQMMDQIELLVNTHMPHLRLVPSQVPGPEEILKLLPESFPGEHPALADVLRHWRERRMQREGNPIQPQLRHDDATRKGEINPYVCFRRRNARQTRQTRRTDQQAAERLVRLRREMEKSRNLCGMVLRREKLRKEGLAQEHAVFTKRCELREFQQRLGIKEEDVFIAAYKKKQRRRSSHAAGSSSGTTTIKIPLRILREDDTDHGKSLAQLAVEKDVARRRELDVGFEDVTQCAFQPFPLDLPYCFFQSFESSNQCQAPQFRRRIGRGGRVLIDRTGFKAPSTLDDRYRFDPDHAPFQQDIQEFDDKSDGCLEYLWNSWQQPDTQSDQQYQPSFSEDHQPLKHPVETQP